jgi:hypothetical protein
MKKLISGRLGVMVGILVLIPLWLPPAHSPLVAQPSTRLLITKRSIGPVRLGMTVARVRKALPGYKLSRTSDGEGLALIAVERRGKPLITIYAGETDPESRINERAVVEFIAAVDASYRTSAGVHPKMTVREVEKKYGKLNEIMMSEIESREYATFARQPQGIQFRVLDDNGTAGIYQEGANRTTRYSPTAYVLSIFINGLEN